MERNFCGEKGQVLSFQAPYFCPNCDEERTETFPASNVSAGTSPDATCPTCKGPMEFDDLPDLYFAFAKIHGAKQVPQEIKTAMENFRSRPSTPAPAAGGSRPATPAIQVPAARAPAPAAVARPASNPQLQPQRPASNPQLQRPPSPSIPARPAAPPQAVALPATPSPAARRPSSPGQQPPAAPGAQQARTSGLKPPAPAARPLMGGSPFPAQRPSGPKQAMPVGAPANGADPGKKP
jgi:hypothetical protein